MAYAGPRRLAGGVRSFAVRLSFFIIESMLLAFALLVGIVQFIWLALVGRINNYFARKKA